MISQRVNNSALNKKIIEALIFSNSLISLEKNQYFLLDKMKKLFSLTLTTIKIILKIKIIYFQKIMMIIFLIRLVTKLEASEKLEFEFKAFGFIYRTSTKLLKVY